MVANFDDLKKMYGLNDSCGRTIGGRCVGNCRKTETNKECGRTIGGRCVGNCRKTEIR